MEMFSNDIIFNELFIEQNNQKIILKGQNL